MPNIVSPSLLIVHSTHITITCLTQMLQDSNKSLYQQIDCLIMELSSVRCLSWIEMLIQFLPHVIPTKPRRRNTEKIYNDLNHKKTQTVICGSAPHGLKWCIIKTTTIICCKSGSHCALKGSPTLCQTFQLSNYIEMIYELISEADVCALCR